MAVDVPKRIWILWIQGLDNAPSIPRLCVDTWIQRNPDWEVTVLSGETLGDWVDPVLSSPKAQSLLPYRLSGLARLDLLAQHGGVWVDATCYCMKPLSEWLPAHMESGFFAFANPAPDRMISSWFLASPPRGYICQRLWEELSRYYLNHTLKLDPDWLQHSDPGAGSSMSPARIRFAAMLYRLLSRNSRLAQLWLAPPLPQLGFTPYFALIYTFGRCYRIDPAFRDIWDRTVKVSANGPHRLQYHGLYGSPSTELLAEFDERRVPFYKLDWRVDPSSLPESSALRVLLDRY